MNLSSGKIWPYAIGVSTVLVFSACIATIVVANTLPVEKSDTYMMGYHEADKNANDLIEAQISFDKKYNLENLSKPLTSENSELKYRVTDKQSNPVNNAEVVVVITRPNSHKYDQTLENPTVENGVYSFSSVNLQTEGRWDIMAQIKVADNQRYYNFKADTRTKKVTEY